MKSPMINRSVPRTPLLRYPLHRAQLLRSPLLLFLVSVTFLTSLALPSRPLAAQDHFQPRATGLSGATIVAGPREGFLELPPLAIEADVSPYAGIYDDAIENYFRGKVFIVETNLARVRTWTRGKATPDAANFMTVPGGPRGLAFGPGRTVYVSYRPLMTSHLQISRYKLFALSAPWNPATSFSAEQKIMKIENAEGGSLYLSPDGLLHIAVNDDPANQSQNPNQPYGKILRIDPNEDQFPMDAEANYRIPWDNYWDTETYLAGFETPILLGGGSNFDYQLAGIADGEEWNALPTSGLPEATAPDFRVLAPEFTIPGCTISPVGVINLPRTPRHGKLSLACGSSWYLSERSAANDYSAPQAESLPMLPGFVAAGWGGAYTRGGTAPAMDGTYFAITQTGTQLYELFFSPLVPDEPAGFYPVQWYGIERLRFSPSFYTLAMRRPIFCNKTGYPVPWVNRKGVTLHDPHLRNRILLLEAGGVFTPVYDSGWRGAASYSVISSTAPATAPSPPFVALCTCEGYAVGLKVRETPPDCGFNPGTQSVTFDPILGRRYYWEMTFSLDPEDPAEVIGGTLIGFDMGAGYVPNIVSIDHDTEP